MTFSEHVDSDFGSRAIHVGLEADANTGAVIPPISLSTTFRQSAAGVHKGYDYSRSGNPSRANFEKVIASLENGRYGVAFSSGSAVTASIIGTLKAGSHVVSVNDVYGGTYRFFNKVAVNHGIETTFVDLADPEALKPALKANTRLVWIETPTNPTLRLVDIAAVAKITHAHGAILVVDNTFMSPYFQTPLDLGADIVVHSVTKYLNGHGDVVMGVAVTSNEEIYQNLLFIQNSMGAVPSAFDCYLARRGVMTLELRMQRHEQNAIAIAEFLQKHKNVTDVIYPGLESHPQHELAKRQQKGFGGMVSFRVQGNIDSVNKILQNLQMVTLAESLGGVETLIEVPAVMTHASLSPEDRAALGITDTLLRLSVGVESARDIIRDLDEAFKAAYA